MIKELLDENVSLESELDSRNKAEDMIVSKSKERVDAKNAFDVLMESSKGGNITNITPKRRKKRLVSKTPTSSSRKTLMEWLKKD